MKREKESRNLRGWCIIDASKSKMHKESTNAKYVNFWRERIQRRGFCNQENESVIVVTLT